MAHLTQATLPRFGREKECPAIPLDVYRQRLRTLRSGMDEAGWDVLAVWGDREHMANVCFLTGFDPRFEEALLLLDRAGKTKLLVGNECMGYVPDPALGLDIELFQEFSLPGQPRASSRPIRRILADFGIGPRVRVGCVGWKRFSKSLIPGGEQALDVPAWLADLLRSLCGGRRHVGNATGLLMDLDAGLRLINEPEQIAAFEYAAAVTSDGVRAWLENLRPGVREDDTERFLDARGLPLTCHRMVGFGAKAQRGLASASGNRARRGDPFTVAFGALGGLTCRAGCIARGPRDLSTELRAFYPRYAANYFDVVCAWYGALRLGVTGGEIFAAVEAVRDDTLFRFAVNPGHCIHLDEWVHSPFAAGDRTVLRSGMALQADLIPVSQGPFCYSNVEDGVVLADAALRADLRARYPRMWLRITRRRRFMKEALGIVLDESVLPLSNTPAWLPLYALDLDTVLQAGSV